MYDQLTRNGVMWDILVVCGCISVPRVGKEFLRRLFVFYLGLFFFPHNASTDYFYTKYFETNTLHVKL